MAEEAWGSQSGTSDVHFVYAGSMLLSTAYGVDMWQPDQQDLCPSLECPHTLSYKYGDLSWELVHHRCCFHQGELLDYKW